MHAETIFSEIGQPEYAVLSARDVTLKNRFEEIYERYYRSLAQDANHVWEFDLERDLLISECGQNETLFDRSETESYTGILDVICQKIPEGYRQRIEGLFNRDRLLGEFDRAHLKISTDYPISLQNDKNLIWVQESAYLTPGPDGHIRVIICIRDIANRDKVKEMFDKAHECDPLSGLLNGDIFRQKVTSVLKNDRRTKEGYLFIIDIDNLEEISNEYGKAYANETIRSLAEALKKCFRSEDILGRVESNEFMAFVSNIDAERAKDRGAEIAENLGRAQHDNVDDLCVVLSVGIAEAGIYDGYTSLHNKAHKALYRAKLNGKASWSLWE